MSNVIEIEAVGNRNLFFRPLGQSVRGCLDFNKIHERGAAEFARDWPEVPGQILGLDVNSGKAWLREPLADPAHGKLRKKLEARSFAIPEQQIEFGPGDVVTWVFWMKRAVASGHARLVNGTFPDLQGKPRRDFLHARKPDPKARLERMHVAALVATMTPAQRKEFDRLVVELED